MNVRQKTMKHTINKTYNINMQNGKKKGNKDMFQMYDHMVACTQKHVLLVATI